MKIKLWPMLSVLIVGAAVASGSAFAEQQQIRISQGFGIGFVPLMIMKHDQLIEKRAAEAGLDVKGEWISLGGPSVANDALLSGRIDFAAVGFTAMAIMWDKTKDGIGVKGAASLVSLPMYLNTRRPEIKRLTDFTDENRIAVTTIKVSVGSLFLQMAAEKLYGFDQRNKFEPLTVSMAHPDAMAALLSGQEVDSHFASPPYQYQELKDKNIHTVTTSYEILGGPSTFSLMQSSEKFRKEHPDLLKVFYSAYKDAIDIATNDKKRAAEIYLAESGDKAASLDEVLSMLENGDINFTMTPEHTMDLAKFMHRVGMIKNEPSSWKDMFFEDIHDLPGS